MLKIRKANFSEFLADIMRYNELVAPVNTDDKRYEQVRDINDIDFSFLPLFPIKKFFFKKKQPLIGFEKGKSKAVEQEHEKKNRVVMGIRRCDLNSIKRQDLMFMKETKDPYYIEERERTILIGYHCNEPYDEYCFCESMDLSDFYDLMLYDRDESYLVEIGSEKGKNFIDKYRKYFWDTEAFITLMDKKIPTKLSLEKKDISSLYNHNDWKKGVDQCLSCAACNTLCPSCYCFDLYDEVEMGDLGKGVRMRNWAACQLQSFTKVAGGHIFRKEREDRFKHRIFHQVQWFRERHGLNLCTGCGRCIRGCPTKINWVNILNEMEVKTD